MTNMTIIDKLRLLPRPNGIEIREGMFDPGDQMAICSCENGKGVLEVTVEQIAVPRVKDALTIETEPGPGWWLQIGDISLPECGYEPESYRLVVESGGIAMVATSEEGFRHGVRTLMQLLDSVRPIPCLDIRDRPEVSCRGVMIDMVRCKERDEVYFRLLEEIAALKMNALFLHFIDNQGCSIELKSRPELVSPHAMSRQTLDRLVQRGLDLGVRIIGEIEPWGHARWIINVYPELGEPGTNSLCLSQDGIYPIIEDVIREMSEMFPDSYLHIGCDEADFSDQCSLCSSRRNDGGELELVARHINRVNRIARDCGKTSMMWADIILRKPDILPLLDKNIVTEDWYYYTDVSAKGLQTLKSFGFKTWAAPALVMGSWRLTPAAYNLENVRMFTQIAKDEGAEGVATTVWLPQRYIPRTLGRGIVYAADLAWSIDERPLDEILGDFILRRYGLTPTPERVDRMLRLGVAGQRNPSQAFWSNKENLIARALPENIIEDDSYKVAVGSLADELRADLPAVNYEREEYLCHALAAEVAGHWAERRLVGRSVVLLIREAIALLETGDNSAASGKLSEAADAIYRMESERSELYSRMRDNWDIDRYPDDTLKDGAHGQTNNLYWWMGNRESFGFAEDLAHELEALSGSLDAARLKEIALMGAAAPDSGDDKEAYVDG